MVSEVDFEVGHPETPVTPVIPERVIGDGAYVAASSLAPRLAVEATSTPRLSSGSPQVRLVRADGDSYALLTADDSRALDMPEVTYNSLRTLTAERVQKREKTWHVPSA